MAARHATEEGATRTARRLLPVLLWVVDAGFALSLAVAAAAWFDQRVACRLGPLSLSASWGWRVLAAPFLLVLLHAGLCRLRAARSAAAPPLARRWFQRLCLAMAAPFLFLLAWEQVLEWADFEAPLPPLVIRDEHGAAPAGDAAVITDQHLLFRFRPGAMFRGRRVNALGFLGREVAPVKPPGTRRVICMGDSVVGQGIPPFTGFLHTALTNAPPTPEPWEAFNMGVHGYTAVQGLRLFELRVPELQPDVVTVLYGWNDHWLAALPDSRRMAVEMQGWRGAVYRRLRQKRFGQWLLSRGAGRPAPAGLGPRVPPDEFRAATTGLVRGIRGIGALPVLITAPRARRITSLVVHNDQAESVEQALADHDRYLAIVRAVAREERVPLLDLAAEFSDPAHAGLFARDGIHFKRQGRRAIAARIHALLTRHFAPSVSPAEADGAQWDAVWNRWKRETGTGRAGPRPVVCPAGSGVAARRARLRRRRARMGRKL